MGYLTTLSIALIKECRMIWSMQFLFDLLFRKLENKNIETTGDTKIW
jgi:hypothetical protein